MKRVAIIGATGAVGNVLTGDICRSGLLEPGDSLILVGHGSGDSDARLFAMRVDLLDAFHESRIHVMFCADASLLEADVVIMVAGLTISAEHPTRRELSMANLPLFESVARTCAARLPNAVFILVSNPVELAVEVFARHTDPRHVIGMGAQQDSLRFARTIAEALGLSRHEVSASVVGEHGQAMLPLWSSVVLDTDDASCQRRLQELREQCLASDLPARVRTLQAEITSLLKEESIAEAYRRSLEEAPDTRIFVEPFITAHTLHSTPHATSNATLHCLRSVLSLNASPVHGQVRAEGQFGGVYGVCGLPLYLSHSGWQAASDSGLFESEFLALQECGRAIQQTLAAAMSEAILVEEPVALLPSIKQGYTAALRSAH